MQIRIWGRNTDKAAEVASDVGGENVKIFNDIQAACAGADVIVTVTMATEPILFGSWLKDDCIVLGRLSSVQCNKKFQSKRLNFHRISISRKVL